MSEQAVVAPAEVADVFNGENPSLSEFNHYRETGELPARFKPAENTETATVDQPEQTVTEGTEPESAAESEAATDQQEKPKKPQTAKERIAQLDAKIEELWDQDEPDTIKIAQLEATKEKIEQRAGLKRKTEQPAPVTQPQAPQQGRQKPSPDDKKADGTPKYNTYEDYVEDLTDWKTEAKIAQREQQYAANQQRREMQTKVDAARERYENFDEVIQPATTAILGDAQIPQSVKEMLNDSDVLPDLMFTLGSDDKALSEFLRLAKQSPTKAARYIAELERGIAEELAPKETPRDQSGKFTPAKPKTSAPKPPSPVTGVSTGAFDVSDESLSNEEWMRQRNAQIAKRKA